MSETCSKLGCADVREPGTCLLCGDQKLCREEENGYSCVCPQGYNDNNGVCERKKTVISLVRRDA